VVVEYNPLKYEGFLSRFWGLLETLSVAGISNLRVDVDTVGLVVGPHAVRRRRICGTRNAELNRMIIVTVEGLLQVPDDRICGNLERFGPKRRVNELRDGGSPMLGRGRYGSYHWRQRSKGLRHHGWSHGRAGVGRDV